MSKGEVSWLREVRAAGSDDVLFLHISITAVSASAHPHHDDKVEVGKVEDRMQLLAHGFNINIIQPNMHDYWMGHVSESDASKLCQGTGVGDSNNMSLTIEALLPPTHPTSLTDDNQHDKFEYQLVSAGQKGKSGTAKFVWKLHKIKEGLKLVVGSVEVRRERTDGECVTDVLRHIITHNLRNNGTINELRRDNLRLAEERRNALEKLRHNADVKEELERSLFTKFIAVLNSKKRRIAELEQCAAAGGSTAGKHHRPRVVDSDSEGSDSGREQQDVDNERGAAGSHTA